MNGRVIILFLAGSLLSGLARGQEPPSLDQLIAQGVQNSAELRALSYQICEAEARIAPAGALPDPMLEVGFKNIPVDAGISISQDPMSGLEIMVLQEVMPKERRRLERGRQADMARMLRERYADKRNDIARRVTRAYRELQSLDEQIRVAEANKQLAEDMLAAAEANYATGKAMQQDVFMAQVRVSQMVEMLISMRRERANAEVMLAEALNCQTGITIGLLPAPTCTSVNLDPEQLIATASAASPQLLEMRVRVEQAEKQVRLADLGLKPNFTFSLAYMLRGRVDDDPMTGAEMWSAGVGINLPWVYRKEKTEQERQAAAAAKNAALEEVSARRNELVSMIRQRVNEVRRADEQLCLLDTGLLPQAEGAVAAARSAYLVGKGSITALLDSQMSFLNYRLQRSRIIAEREINLAEINYLVGCSPTEGGVSGS